MPYSTAARRIVMFFSVRWGRSLVRSIPPHITQGISPPLLLPLLLLLMRLQRRECTKDLKWMQKRQAFHSVVFIDFMCNLYDQVAILSMHPFARLEHL